MAATDRTPEWLRLLRGFPAYLICFYTPIDHWWAAYLWLLPYAGDWAYRHERRTFDADKLLKEQTP